MVVAAMALAATGFGSRALVATGAGDGSVIGRAPETVATSPASPPATSTTTARPHDGAKVPPGGDAPDRSQAGLALPIDFPDPAGLPDGAGYLAFSTQSGGMNVPVVTTADLESWSAPIDALPQLPVWGTTGPVWAPAALRNDDGRYLLAYATRHDSTGIMCVSIAVAERGTGPYVDASAAPLVCDEERGGSIDPSFFVDPNGATWLLWKSEGLAGADPARIFSQQIDPLSLTLLDEPAELLRRDRAWEHPTVENPAMAFLGDSYVLLYSGNRWDTSSYATGWATCQGPLGPCAKAPEPLLTGDGERSGPGGASWLATPSGKLWIAYHGWTAGAVGYPAGQRALYLADPVWDGSWLTASTTPSG
jgi:beta-xylosidase